VQCPRQQSQLGLWKQFACAGEPFSPPSDALALAAPQPSPSASQSAMDTAAYGGAATSGCLVDAGLMLGQACRVGWAPNGTLVIPGKDISCARHSSLASAYHFHSHCNVLRQTSSPISISRLLLQQVGRFSLIHRSGMIRHALPARPAHAFYEKRGKVTSSASPLHR